MTTEATEDPLTPPAHAHHVVVSGGELFVWMPRPGIIVQKASGILSLALSRGFEDVFRRIDRPAARARIFDDFEQLTSYTREAREHAVALALEHLEALEAIHILHASKHLALGISSFKHQIGDHLVHTYSDRSSFVRSYEAAVRGH